MGKIQPISLEDVAVAAGVSRNAVSLALRNRPGVSESTRQSIQEIAQAMGYRPNPLVTTLMNNVRANKQIESAVNIAFLHCLRDDKEWRRRAYYKEFFEGARQRGEETGFSVFPFWLDQPGLSRKRIRQILIAQGVRGMIIGPVERRRHIRMDWNDFALASIGMSLWRPVLHRAHSDMQQCLSLAIRHLRKLRYDRIGIAYTEHSDSRYDFAWSAATASEIAKHQNCICSPFVGEKFSIENFDGWLKHENPDVVVDASLRNLDKVLKELGYRAPQDIGYCNIVGTFDNPESSRVKRDFKSIGSSALDLISAQLMRNEYGLPSVRKSVVIEGVWIPGKTVSRQGR